MSNFIPEVKEESYKWRAFKAGLNILKKYQCIPGVENEMAIVRILQPISEEDNIRLQRLGWRNSYDLWAIEVKEEDEEEDNE